jgi:hypothetical protein
MQPPDIALTVLKTSAPDGMPAAHGNAFDLISDQPWNRANKWLLLKHRSEPGGSARDAGCWRTMARWKSRGQN